MNEQEQMSQLSALFDNELPPAEAELVIRRLLKDPALRARWDRYAQVGACLRGEPVRSSTRQPDVAERVRRQLSAEAEAPQVGTAKVAAWPGQRRGWRQFGRGALGGGIAAGVAALALVVVNSMGPTVATTQMAEASGPAAVATEVPVQAAAPQATAPVQVAATDTPPPSITTPVASASQTIGGSRANFAVSHRDVAVSGRLLPLSAAVNGYDITQGTVVMTEAEIRSFRD